MARQWQRVGSGSGGSLAAARRQRWQLHGGQGDGRQKRQLGGGSTTKTLLATAMVGGGNNQQSTMNPKRRWQQRRKLRRQQHVTLLGVPWYLYRYLPTCLLFIKVLPLLVTQVELCQVYPGYAQSFESVPMTVPQVSILPCLFFDIINRV